jgi:protein-tyrosine-phosphatase
MARSGDGSILFLCTGNYYRSRFAEILFNAVAGRLGLSWQALSRGLALERGVNNVGPMAVAAIAALEALGVRAADAVARLPGQVTADDLERADRVVALKQDEHRPLLQERFPGWAEKVEYWQVDDAPEALALIEQEVVGLVARIRGDQRERVVTELDKRCRRGVPVPRQNRVTPFGALAATPERGTFMGNRGLLHDEAGRIKRAWQVKRWLVCVLEFRGRKRQVMRPGHYTELFFLDEATALAAGHRPCAECRRERFNAFGEAWATNRPGRGARKPSAAEIDNRLHAERLAPDGSKRVYAAALDELPDGVLVQVPGWGERALLVWGGSLLVWSPGGYQERRPCRTGKEVMVLTPPSTVGAIRAGYVPEVHPSAGLP